MLQAFDNHSLASAQSALHDPAIASDAVDLDLTLLDLALSIDEQHDGLACRITLHSSLRHRDAVRIVGLIQLHANEAAGQQQLLRIGKLAAQGDLPRALINRQIREQQDALERVGGAILLNEGGLSASWKELAAGRSVAIFAAD